MEGIRENRSIMKRKKMEGIREDRSIMKRKEEIEAMSFLLN